MRSASLTEMLSVFFCFAFVWLASLKPETEGKVFMFESIVSLFFCFCLLFVTLCQSKILVKCLEKYLTEFFCEHKIFV